MKIALIGDPILNTPAVELTDSELSQPVLQQFIQQLKHTMLASNGMGIAAPQVFDSRAIMIIASRPNDRYPQAPYMQPVVLINPKIVQQSQTLLWDWEGCLSVPGLRGRIERADWVEVSYLDQTGQQQKQKFTGFVARIFLHEYDHLIGKTWLDHIQSTQDVMANELWLEKFAYQS